MTNPLRAFFDRIRSSEEPVRRRWAAVLSTATMVVVAGLWTWYLTLTVPQANAPEVAAAIPGTNFLETVGVGASVIGGEASKNFRRAYDYLGNLVDTTTSVTVRSSEQNFIVESLPLIPPIQLP